MSAPDLLSGCAVAHEQELMDTKGSSSPSIEKEDTDEPSDIEEGGLDLNVSLQPISSYMADRKEMLEQCFRVIGEKKLQKMLPDVLKSCSIEEIKHLCLEQLELLPEKKLLHILEGEDALGSSDSEDEEDADGDINKEKASMESQQDNNVDSTSSLKECVEVEAMELKQEGGASDDDSDALSINAEEYDSDIGGACDGADENTCNVKSSGGTITKPANNLQQDIETSDVCASDIAPNK
ncbi:caspase activity and apoptosis inhibitor 1 [Protopterus annectens]|uniref:caspase activity and apoptosis inhibitor 1 n=1 Tax=Protopterus annectens TaxID=7888 RepID=UPI001CFB4513|nr:caspase activity and apoptosis inhibitor 1 [Protopterus annectens]